MAITTSVQCDHITGETLAGQATTQITGICRKCGVDLDIARLENWCRFLEKRIKKLELSKDISNTEEGK